MHISISVIQNLIMSMLLLLQFSVKYLDARHDERKSRDTCISIKQLTKIIWKKILRVGGWRKMTARTGARCSSL